MNDTTAKELDRLADWLRAQGMTPAQVLDYLKYIAGTTPPRASAGKKKPGSAPPQALTPIHPSQGWPLLSAATPILSKHPARCKPAGPI